MIDIVAGLERRLSPEALRMLTAATDLAAEKGQNLYLVGGIVRDLLLDRANLDLDLVLEGDAIALARSLASRLRGRLVIHQRFGTATVSVNSLTLDLATARTELYARPGSLPEVQPSTLVQDLRRRDFTINAMAMELSRPGYGGLVDPLGGRGDLEAGLVRVIHDGSFVDDATRLLRAVRYEQRFGFRLEESTGALARRDAGMLSTISGDRLRHEMQRILAEARPEQALERAHQLGVLQAIHPALRWDVELSRSFHRARQAGDEQTRVYVAIVAQDLTESDLEEVAQRLRFPKSWASVARDAQRLDPSLYALEAPGLPASQIAEALDGYSPEAIRACRAVNSSAIIRERLAVYLDKLRRIRPALDGDDLLALGVPQGPSVGEVLTALKKARLDGVVGSKDEESAFVKRWLQKR